MIRVLTPYYKSYETIAPILNALDKNRFQPLQAKGTLIANARNHLVTGTVNNSLKKQPIPKCDFLFIDSDIVCTVEDVEKIVELGKKYPVISFPYPYATKQESQYYVCGEWNRLVGNVGLKYSTQAKGCHAVAWCGAGFLYIRREVFQALEFPYFRPGVLEYGDNANLFGEDIGFCMELHKKNIPIYCSFDNPVGHEEIT